MYLYYEQNSQRLLTLVCTCRSSPFASLLRLAFGLKLPQQFLRISQLVFEQPYFLLVYLIFIDLSPSSLANDPCDLPLLFI